MIKKVKDWLGIEGVKVELILPETLTLTDEIVKGSIRITSQSDQYVESAHFVLKERYQRGRRKSKLIDEYILGRVEMKIDQHITSDQVIEKEFELPFEPLRSDMDRWGRKNSLYRGIAALAKLAKNARSTFTVIVELSVRGNKLKPYAKQEVTT